MARRAVSVARMFEALRRSEASRRLPKSEVGRPTQLEDRYDEPHSRKAASACDVLQRRTGQRLEQLALADVEPPEHGRGAVAHRDADRGGDQGAGDEETVPQIGRAS